MGEGLTDFRARGHFPGLNGIRCLSILIVVWHHSYSGPSVILGRGFIGVDIFFVLSGFLIATLLVRERRATGSISLRQFWLRRALRLFPPFYLMMALLAAYYAMKPGNPQAVAFFESAPANLLYLSNWLPNGAANLGILWSLATEQQFYLVWPLVELLAPRRAVPILLVFVALNQLVNFQLPPPLDGIHDFSIGQATYTPICLGVLLAHGLDDEHGHRRLAALFGGRSAPYVLLVSLAALLLFAPADISGLPRLAIQLVATALVGALVVQPVSSFTSALEGRVIARIGIISYGMYLYHQWALHVVRPLLDRLELNMPVALFLSGLAVTCIVAEISFRFVEQPILRFARRFRPSPRQGITPISAGREHSEIV